MTSLLRPFSNLFLASFLILMSGLIPGLARAQSAPTFTAVFSPDTVTTGNNTSLIFTLTETSASTASDLTFSATLPTGVTVAAGSQSNSCSGTFTATSGGTSLSLTEGRLGASESCTITLPVTSSTVATHTLTTGDLTSSQGNSGSATDDLIVSLPTPVFSHSFSPSTVNPGDISTLTYTIDNTGGGLNILAASFDETLPSGLALTTPANISNSCGGTVVAASGGDNIDADSLAVTAGASCTITVDVEALSLGDQIATSTLFSTFSNFSSSQVTGTGTLVVEAPTPSEINFSKSFSLTQVGLSQNVTLSFDLQNTSRDSAATNIAFTDDLDAMLSGLVATSLPADGFCGAGSTLTGSGSLTLAGASLASSESCSFDVTLLTPAAATTGDYTNTTSALTADIGGNPYTGGTATADLRILGDGGQGASLSKSVIDNPVAPGGSGTLRYTLTNPNASFALSDVTFSDIITDITGGNDVTINTLPTAGDCGAGSTFAQTFVDTDTWAFTLTDGVLAAGDSCSFDLVLSVASDATPGDYDFTTGDVNSTVNGGSVVTLGASATLQVEGGANLSFVKEFTESVIGAGDSATLTFALASEAESPNTATGLSFSDDLTTFLSGASFSTVSDSCGGSPALSAGDTLLSYSGGSLAPGASCEIVMSVAIPAGASNGTYTNTSSSLAGTAGGEALTVPASSDDLQVLAAEPLVTSKSFAPSSALPGETIRLSYSLQNPDAAATYDITLFTESLSTPLSGLGAVDASTAVFDNCGGSASGSGTTFLIFLNLEVLPTTTCTIDLDVVVPLGAADGTYGTTTSSLSAQLDGNAVTLDPIVANLLVEGELISLSKSYASSPTAPGGSVSVDYTLTNLSSSHALSALAFSDDLDAQLSGLTSSSGSLSDICGSGSAISGTSPLSFSGGSLAAGASCSFSVTQVVPAGASAETHSGDTSSLTGTASGLAVTGPATSAALTVSSFDLPSFTASLADSALASGGSSTLTYVITNTDTSATLSDLRFSTDLDAVISGMTVTSGTGSDLCGAGSSLTGSSLLTLSGASLAPSDSCSLDLVVQLPSPATAGSYDITSASLTEGGTVVAAATTASFTVEPAPGFTQSFSPATVDQGGTSTVTFTIDNSAAALAASGLDFSNTLPSGLVVASPANASTTCTGGTITAVTNTSTLSYTGGSTSAGASCTVAVDVKATVGGSFVNTSGDLTSSLGDSGSSSDTLTATATSVSLDQDPITTANESAVSFTFANAEVGASYSYGLSSSGGGTTVTGSGTVSSSSEQISGLDVSGLGDGTVTLAVGMTGSLGHAAPVINDTATKDTDRPSVTLSGPSDAQSHAFSVTVTFSESVTGLADSDFSIDGGTATALTGSGTSYTLTVSPDHDGTLTISLPLDAAVNGSGNGNSASSAIEVTADLTGTPDPSPEPDADGDGVPDSLESSSADRDGDGIVDSADYDPQGYFYCEDDGRILSGGGITVTGDSGSNSSVGTANNITIVRDGSTGEYQWFALVPGTYSVAYSYPSTGVASTARLSSGSIDVTTLLPSNPAVLGSTEVGSTGVLADASLAANPVFYDTFVIEAGDPDVLANNIPMTNCQINAVTVSASDTGAEANGGATDSVSFTVSQDLVSAQDSVISYTLGGTATSGTDYTAPSGSVTILTGDTSAVVDLPVLEDGLIEGDETVTLTLTAVTSGAADVALSTTPADLTGSTTLFDDDSAVISVTNDDLTASESGNDTAAMSFVLLGQPTADVQLDFAGDAQCNVSPASLTFTSGTYDTSQSLTITAIDDDVVEGSHSCQPTVTVSSGDAGFDGFALTLSAVTVTDDLIDQIREPLTEILKNDLEQTVRNQQRHFSTIAKGALSRLQAGAAGLGCGTLSSFDIDGSLNIQGGTGQSDGTFGYDVYNCASGSRQILAGSFSLTRSESIGTQALVQFSQQRERFLSEQDLRGRFWGGYLSRTNVTGLADGSINGFGVNGGVYGARQLGDGLFLDYYAAGAVGHHRFDLSFATTTTPIQADGSYDYAALFGGIALSGQHQLDRLRITPRVGLDLAIARASDADVTATQLSQTDTGSIDIPDFDGSRIFAEIEFSGFGNSAEADPRGVQTSLALTPRLICETSSYDSSLGCGLGLGFAHELFNPLTGLSYRFEIDYETVNDSDRLSANFHRERRFANDRGAVVTRLSMPNSDALKIEHGVRLEF